MEYPERIWRDYTPAFDITEKYTPEGYSCQYPATLTSRKKIHDWQAIRMIYQYLRRIAQKRTKYYRKVLYVEYNFMKKPFELTATIKANDSSILSKMVIWSQDQEQQEHIKQLFNDWAGIESLYMYLVQKVKAAQEWERGAEERARKAAEQARIKEERREKRALNDPDNPAARKRKARRHLQRLGYDLHKSRKIVKTEDDHGLYQIVKLDSGKVVAGKLFDLTLDEVERFYRDCDYANMDKYDEKYSLYFGYMYNQEPKLKERKAAAAKALKKMGYELLLATEIEYDHHKEYYNSDCYCIRLLKNKRKVKWREEEYNNISAKYLVNEKNNRLLFTLSEVEAFISSKS